MRIERENDQFVTKFLFIFSNNQNFNHNYRLKEMQK